jgi:hypothetical protein
VRYDWTDWREPVLPLKCQRNRAERLDCGAFTAVFHLNRFIIQPLGIRSKRTLSAIKRLSRDAFKITEKS